MHTPMLRRALRAPSILIAAALLAAGCTGAPSAEEAASGDGDGAFPVTIEHALGETTIESKPERVLTIGDDSTDIAVALDVIPVAIPRNDWSGDADGYAPWIREGIEDRGGELPEFVKMSDAGEVDFEHVLELKPDVILAVNSGITETDYERLSQIAPTVGYAERIWATEGWEATTRTVATALGEQEKAEEVITRTEELFAAEREEHPEFEGTSFVYGLAIAEGVTEVAFYPRSDPRVDTFHQLGFVDPEDMAEREKTMGDGEYWISLSMEELDQLPVDFWVGWAENQEEVDRTEDNALIQRWKPFAEGHTMFVTDRQLGAAVGGCMLLGVEWGLAEFSDDVAAALAGDDGA